MTCTKPNCTCTGNIPVHPITKAGKDWRGLIGIAFALVGVVGFVLTLGVVM